MMRLMVPVILSLAAITKANLFPSPYHSSPYYSAASEAQIRFALENKYDDTGPGAKEPEYAYSTYKTLEEALLGYLDDPDTKLPEQEKNRAIQSLNKQENYREYKPDYKNQELKRYYPKTVEEYTGYNRQKQQEQTLEEFRKLSQPKTVQVYKGYRQPQPQTQLVLTKLRTNAPKKYYQSLPQHNSGYLKQSQRDKELVDAYRWQPKTPNKGNQLRVSHYTRTSEPHYARDPDLLNAYDQFDPHPKYTYSYGVHVPDTGDSKSAQETREGGTVRGFYSFRDPDGKQRTVHYTANDGEGFRATVDRTAQ